MKNSKYLAFARACPGLDGYGAFTREFSVLRFLILRSGPCYSILNI